MRAVISMLAFVTMFGCQCGPVDTQFEGILDGENIRFNANSVQTWVDGMSVNLQIDGEIYSSTISAGNAFYGDHFVLDKDVIDSMKAGIKLIDWVGTSQIDRTLGPTHDPDIHSVLSSGTDFGA